VKTTLENAGTEEKHLAAQAAINRQAF